MRSMTKDGHMITLYFVGPDRDSALASPAYYWKDEAQEIKDLNFSMGKYCRIFMAVASVDVLVEV